VGTSKSVSDLAGKCNKYATAIPKANEVALRQAALAAKEVMIANAATIGGLKVGQPLPKAGKGKWGARYDIKQGLTSRTEAGVSKDAVLRYIGPVHWAEGGTKPHFITPAGVGGSRSSRAGRAAAANLFTFMVAGGSVEGVYGGLRRSKASSGRARALKVGGQFAMWAKHPGAKARPFWSPTKAQIAVQTPRVFQAAYTGALVRTFT